MATEKQITANRSNGKKGGGPKTMAGKARSSQNAIKHSFYSKRELTVTNWHNQSKLEFAAYREKVFLGLNVRDEIGRILAEIIVNTSWRLHRLEKHKDAISSEVFTGLQFGDVMEEVVVLKKRILMIEETLSLLVEDITIVEGMLIGDFSDPDWTLLHHLRTFLEKSIIIDDQDDRVVPIAETLYELIAYLCDRRSITCKVLIEDFLGYLQEQFGYWNSEMKRSKERYEQLEKTNPREVSESSYIIAVESHPSFKEVSIQEFHLEWSLNRTVKEYIRSTTLFVPKITDKNE